MATSQANRWGGLSAMLAGLFIILWVITDVMDYDLFVAFVPAALLLLFLSFPAMHRSHGGRNGGLGKAGYWILMVSGGLFVLLAFTGLFIDLVLGKDPENLAPAIFGGPVFGVIFFALMLGVLIFGIASVIAGRIPKLAGLFFLLGLPLGLFLDFVIFQVGDEESGPGFYIGIPMFAVGIAWIGWWIWSGKGAGSLSFGANAE